MYLLSRHDCGSEAVTYLQSDGVIPGHCIGMPRVRMENGFLITKTDFMVDNRTFSIGGVASVDIDRHAMGSDL